MTREAEYLKRFEELVKQNTEAQTKVRNTLEKALNRLSEAEKKYNEFNNSGWMKFLHALKLLAPLLLPIVLFMGALFMVPYIVRSIDRPIIIDRRGTIHITPETPSPAPSLTPTPSPSA